MDMQSANVNELCEWFSRGIDCYGSWYKESLFLLVMDWRRGKESEEEIKNSVDRWLFDH